MRIFFSWGWLSQQPTRSFDQKHDEVATRQVANEHDRRATCEVVSHPAPIKHDLFEAGVQAGEQQTQLQEFDSRQARKIGRPCSGLGQ